MRFSCENSCDLYYLFSEIKQQISTWEKCDILFSCPDTHEGLSILFPNNNIVSIFHPNDIYKIIELKKFNNIGIASPWLFATIERDCSNIFFKLQKSCRNHLVIADGYRNGLESIQLRKLLHKIGFYEIAQCTNSQEFDFSTVNFLQDGRFDYLGSKIGLPEYQDNWITLVAGRMPLTNDLHRFPWKNVSLCSLYETNNSFRAEPNSFAIITLNNSDINTETRSTEVKGTVKWEKASTGHLSLLANYTGPGDSYMYAAITQLVDDTNAYVSLWMNDGKWLCLTGVPIPNEMVLMEGSVFSLPLWLKVDAQKISIGSKKILLIQEHNTQLIRTPSIGVRISGGNFSIADLDYSIESNNK